MRSPDTTILGGLLNTFLFLPEYIVYIGSEMLDWIFITGLDTVTLKPHIQKWGPDGHV